MKKILIFILCICFLPYIYGCKNTDKITNYYIKLSLEKQELLGEMQVEFNLQADNYVDFNLFGNAYRKDAEFFAVEEEYLPVEKRYGEMEILSVNSSKYLSYQLLQDNALLRVYLNAKKGQRVSVYIKFRVLLSNFAHRLGSGEQVVNLGNFYPVLCVYEKEYIFCPYYNIGDTFYSEVANYKVDLLCDGEYIVASSGFCEKVENLYGKTKYTYSLNNARDFAFCLSKYFKVDKQTYNGVDIYYYYLNGESEVDLIKNSLNYFNSFYSYPYKTYSVCQTDFCYGGMEYPALVYINKSLLEQEKYLTIVHETAHQWWYGIVGNNQITNACLDEGLTEFSTIIFFENYLQYNILSKNLLSQKITNYSSFKSLYKAKYGLESSLSPTRSLNEYKNALKKGDIDEMKKLLADGNEKKLISEKMRRGTL